MATFGKPNFTCFLEPRRQPRGDWSDGYIQARNIEASSASFDAVATKLRALKHRNPPNARFAPCGIVAKRVLNSSGGRRHGPARSGDVS